MRFRPSAPRNVLAVSLLVAAAPTVEGAEEGTAQRGPRRLIGIAHMADHTIHSIRGSNRVAPPRPAQTTIRRLP